MPSRKQISSERHAELSKSQAHLDTKRKVAPTGFRSGTPVLSRVLRESGNIDSILNSIRRFGSHDKVETDSLLEYWQTFFDTITVEPKKFINEAGEVVFMAGTVSPKAEKYGLKFFYVFRRVIEDLYDKGMLPDCQNALNAIAQKLDNETAYKDIIIIIKAEIGGIIAESESDLKKKYRRRAELPDPTKASDAEVNRLTRQVKLRMNPDIADAIDAAVEGSGETRSDWYVRAALERIKVERPDLYEVLVSLEGPEFK